MEDFYGYIVIELIKLGHSESTAKELIKRKSNDAKYIFNRNCYNMYQQNLINKPIFDVVNPSIKISNDK